MSPEDFGLKVPDLVAGASGGIVNSFMYSRSSPWAIIGAIAVGALTSNYCTDTAVKFTGTNQGLTGFALGIGGMFVCKKLMELVQQRVSSAGGKDNA